MLRPDIVPRGCIFTDFCRCRKDVRYLFLDLLRNGWHAFYNVMKSISLVDIVDIALLTFIMYLLLKFVRETRAGQLMKGVVLLILVYFLSGAIELKAIHWLSKNVLDAGLIAIIILFQPELRRVLEKFGQTTIHLSRLTFGESEEIADRWDKAIPIICEAVGQLSATTTGALIVIERGTKLGEQILNGTVMKAEPSTQLFGNIFYNKTPLHDGAVIMRDGIIWAAACFLPKPQKEELIDKHLGSRHRAAIGMSENSDALVIVVSEETGQISVALDGVLTRNYTPKSLEKFLRGMLLPNDEDDWRNQTLRLPFWKKEKNPAQDQQSATQKQKQSAPQKPQRKQSSGGKKDGSGTRKGGS